MRGAGVARGGWGSVWGAAAGAATAGRFTVAATFFGGTGAARAAAGAGRGACTRGAAEATAPTLNTAITSVRWCTWSRSEVAAAVDSSTSAAFSCVIAWLTWAMPSRCSADEAVISPIRSLTRCTLATISFMLWPASATCCDPVSTFSTEAPMSCLISLAASAERPARLRTSLATTAKPRPCSPARAASTAALSARMLVWKAMPSITPMMSAILRELCVISCMLATTWPTTWPPRVAAWAALAASWLAWRAVSADCVTVAVSCSMLAAVCCRLEAVCSVRADRSWLPMAISEDASDTASTPVRQAPRRNGVDGRHSLVKRTGDGAHQQPGHQQHSHQHQRSHAPCNGRQTGAPRVGLVAHLLAALLQGLDEIVLRLEIGSHQGRERLVGKALCFHRIACALKFPSLGRGLQHFLALGGNVLQGTFFFGVGGVLGNLGLDFVDATDDFFHPSVVLLREHRVGGHRAPHHHGHGGLGGAAPAHRRRDAFLDHHHIGHGLLHGCRKTVQQHPRHQRHDHHHAQQGSPQFA